MPNERQLESGSTRLDPKHIVLLGAGHTHAHIIRMWAMNPLPQARLTCVSDNAVATYSGMLPAVLARQNTRQDMQIDLVKLCGIAGVRLILDKATGLSEDKRSLTFEKRPNMPFDYLSIGIGSVPNMQGAGQPVDDGLITIKPMQSFLKRLESAITLARQRVGKTQKLRIIVVGSGVAGTEIAFCLPGLLDALNVEASLGILTRSSQVLSGSNSRVQKLARQKLQERGVEITPRAEVIAFQNGQLTYRSQDRGTTESTAVDVVIWATAAAGPALLQQLGLPLDERGFILTDSMLRSVSEPHIFAVGDSGSHQDNPAPKAGVYAVRQGPVLWENLQRSLGAKELIPFRPQQNFLKLINTGDGQAIGEWGWLALQGRWLKRLKDWIDESFMEKYRLAPMESDGPMQCRGCGCKLPADALRQSLTASGASTAVEDASAIGDGELIASTDFFTLPLDDPYANGRIAALHASSDVLASGAIPTQSLANVVVPDGEPNGGQQWLAEFLSGARHEFEAMGAEIVAGHTILGPRAEAGFTVIGRPIAQAMINKGGLQQGDQLLLTRPLGTGVALAALMRGICPAELYLDALASMLLRQHAFATIAATLQISAATDVTGFGLAGHLLEMLSNGNVSARLQLSQVPLLPGVMALSQQGVSSSLYAENARVSSQMRVGEEAANSDAYPLLFDPQTCGGFLFALAPGRVEEAAALFRQADLARPTIIGEVRAKHPAYQLEIV